MLRFVPRVSGHVEYLMCLGLFFVFIASPGFSANYRVLSGPASMVGESQTAYVGILNTTQLLDSDEVGGCELFEIQWASEAFRWVFSLWRPMVAIMIYGVGLSLALYPASTAIRDKWWILKSVVGIGVVLAPAVAMLIGLGQSLPGKVMNCSPEEPVVEIQGMTVVWWAMLAWVGAVALMFRIWPTRFRAGAFGKGRNRQAAA